jgi:DNA-directed RNA polymerase specialized sigma24 family protein
MGTTSDEALHDYVAARYRDLRRSAFLMCGDWALADELTRTSLARLVAEAHRDPVHDPDAYVYADLMAAFQHRPARREHVFVAGPDTMSGTAPDAAITQDTGAADRQIQTVLVLDALHHLTPRCRAVLVLRHGTGFTVDETADVLDLADDRVEAYEAAGLAALSRLLEEVAAR